MTVEINVPDETLVSQIYLIGGRKVMIDRDLAKLYGVETKMLKRAVKRNITRFPPDFMFEMSPEEFRNWRCQFGTSNSDKMGLRHIPFCFTEQGVTMLSCVLSSERAIAVNIRIVRLFTRLREMMLSHKDILRKLEELERATIQNSEDIQAVFAALKELLNSPGEPRKAIGYKPAGSAD